MSVSTKVPTKVQKRSGFSKSHHNALSQKLGVITPILVDEVIPNTKVHLRYAMAGSMPPLAMDAYMKVYYDIRAFFVPFRLLYGGFESWFSDYEYPVVINSSPTNAIGSKKAAMPYFSISSSASLVGIFGAGTLSDYLGYKVDEGNLAGLFDTAINISMLPYLAYHRVCNDWFRQSNVTKEFFAKPSAYSAMVFSQGFAPAMAPYIEADGGAEICPVTAYNNTNCKLADGVSIFELRKANYDYDYFTNALPSAQLGNPVTIASGTNFTIASLRLGNSLQQFAELNELCGSNLVDVVKARYGANLGRGVAQRCVYLGGARLDMATKSVDITSGNSGTSSTNPWKTQIAASGGKVLCQGSDLIIDDFTAEEPGYIFVVGVVIPKATYGSGIRRYLRHYIGAGSLTDMATPQLQNIGNQPIYSWELDSSLGISGNQNGVFGYTDRYAEFMTMEDECHGLLSYFGSLNMMVAQRFFDPTDQPTLTTNFLSVDDNDLNNVTAVSGNLSLFGFYGQFAFEYYVSQPLAQYSLPSLQNPAYEHGKTVMVHRGGFRF